MPHEIERTKRLGAGDNKSLHERRQDESIGRLLRWPVERSSVLARAEPTDVFPEPGPTGHQAFLEAPAGRVVVVGGPGEVIGQILLGLTPSASSCGYR